MFIHHDLFFNVSSFDLENISGPRPCSWPHAKLASLTSLSFTSIVLRFKFVLEIWPGYDKDKPYTLMTVSGSSESSRRSRTSSCSINQVSIRA